jgi:hypothetical protein
VPKIKIRSKHKCISKEDKHNHNSKHKSGIYITANLKPESYNWYSRTRVEHDHGTKNINPFFPTGNDRSTHLHQSRYRHPSPQSRDIDTDIPPPTRRWVHQHPTCTDIPWSRTSCRCRSSTSGVYVSPVPRARENLESLHRSMHRYRRLHVLCTPTSYMSIAAYSTVQ